MQAPIDCHYRIFLAFYGRRHGAARRWYHALDLLGAWFTGRFNSRERRHGCR
jgi:hypothetical protein